MRLFIDTWGWITLFNKREPFHDTVKSSYEDLRSQKGILYTSDYVLDETFTLLFRRVPYAQAKEALEKVDDAIRSGHLIVTWITPERFEKCKTLRLQLQDKPNISFTDLSSVVVMKDLGLTLILTKDQHFLHVGLDLQIVPAL